jgi:hypothetical protein
VFGLKRRTFQNPKGHIVITGTGRAGTTLMVRIFTELGMDTGFQRESFAAVEKNAGRAGLEHSIMRHDSKNKKLPMVVKSPWLVDELPDALANGTINIDVAIIPVRKLEQAASSRVAVTKKHVFSGGEPSTAPGGLWKTNNPDRQEEVLATQFYKTIETLSHHEIPMIFPSFPRFVTDFDHFDRTVGKYLRTRFGFSRTAIQKAWAEQCKPEFISQH